VPVPEGSYDDENMKSTVVPNRNMIMLSMAAGLCIAIDGSFVATGVHAGDHAIYPDCRPEFLALCEKTIKKANAGFISMDFVIHAPFIDKTKTDIAILAGALDVPINRTWSCYNGGMFHCGRCGTCVERLEALDAAGVEDDTIYLDNNFWKDAIKK
jgi:7-cyano-7-deazaguanine synthase